ncbi:MAG: signal peptidase I [Nanoarchaeota archaeon]
MFPMIRKALALALAFIVGMLATAMYAQMTASQPFVLTPSGGLKDVPSPSDWIKEKDIAVYSDRVVLSIKDVQWATFTDTNSMDPVIDAGSNALEVIPSSEDDIHVGDIVAYKSDYSTGTIIHRVVYKGNDEDGTYFVLKGDNNPINDPGKIRFSQIKRVLVAVIY